MLIFPSIRAGIFSLSKTISLSNRKGVWSQIFKYSSQLASKTLCFQKEGGAYLTQYKNSFYLWELDNSEMMKVSQSNLMWFIYLITTVLKRIISDATRCKGIFLKVLFWRSKMPGTEFDILWWWGVKRTVNDHSA